MPMISGAARGVGPLAPLCYIIRRNPKEFDWKSADFSLFLIHSAENGEISYLPKFLPTYAAL